MVLVVLILLFPIAATTVQRPAFLSGLNCPAANIQKAMRRSASG
jgi:hypothetical protein